MKTRHVIRDCIVSVAGGVLYGCSLNLFVIPHGLYMGTFAGVAQVLEAITQLLFPRAATGPVNLTGVYLFVMNIPLLILALRELSRLFLLKTVLTVTLQSLAMALVPIPSTPPVDNVLTAALIGGLIAGFGAGITLRAGGSGGGSDVLGMVFTKKYPNFSVGKITLAVSALVYAYCLLRYDLNIVIHSVLFTVAYSFCLDRFHHQNIKTSVTIFSRREDVLDFVLDGLHRGATCWTGTGAYTRKTVYVTVTAISKFEVARLKRELAKLDPAAFAIVNEGVDVLGYFEKHL